MRNNIILFIFNITDKKAVLKLCPVTFTNFYVYVILSMRKLSMFYDNEQTLWFIS